LVAKHDFKMSLEPFSFRLFGVKHKTSMKMIPTPKHVVVFGGQYGSEGKASAAEYWAKQLKRQGCKLFVLGERSPTSGHTSSRGATKNIPASSFWADAVILGPDAVVDKDVLLHDWETVGKPPLYIHEHAALLHPETKPEEADFVARISSIGSGSGVARKRKFIDRQADAVVKTTSFPAFPRAPCWTRILDNFPTSPHEPRSLKPQWNETACGVERLSTPLPRQCIAAIGPDFGMESPAIASR
jgi:hypothetical protein